MAAAVTVASAVIAFPIAYMAARYAGPRLKALFYLGVMLPLWSSYLVRVYAWKLILAKEGVISWAAAGTGTTWLLDGILALPGIGGPSLSVSYLGMFLVFTYIWLPFMILPVQAALERVPGSLIEAAADLGARPAPGLPHRDPAPGHPRPRRRLDLHLLADARATTSSPTSSARRGCSSARRSTSSRAPPGTSRWPPPSRSCRS